MDEFKIGDEIVEVPESDKKRNKKIPIIIIVIVSLLFGLSVFFISNALFGKKKVEQGPITSTELELDNEDVQILYKYVTYGTRGTRNNKFIKEQSVTLDDFSNYEKFYYALQFAQEEDLANTGKTNDQNQKIYNISSAKIKKYMQRFFGTKVTYSNNTVIDYPFSFKINNQNVAHLKYNDEREGFDVVFTGTEENIESHNLVEPYYTKLVEATEKSDGTIELLEKIIYTTIEQNNDAYNVYIYKDYNKTMLLDSKNNLTEQELKEKPIDISDYEDNAATITYLFKVNYTNYYFFNSSKITN